MTPGALGYAPRGLFLPDGVPRIDWSNPLTQGLTGCWVVTGDSGPNTIRDLVSQTTLAATGSPAIQSGPYGLEARSTSNTSGYVGTSTAAQRPTSAASILWFGRILGSAGTIASNPRLFSCDYNASGGSPYVAYGLTRNTDQSHVAFYYNNGSSQSLSDIQANLVTGMVTCLVGTLAAGAAVRLFQNGVQIGQATPPVGSISYNAASVIVTGYTPSNTTYTNTTTMVGVTWNRALTQFEATIISADPTAFLIYQDDEILSLLTRSSTNTPLSLSGSISQVASVSRSALYPVGSLVSSLATLTRLVSVLRSNNRGPIGSLVRAFSHQPLSNVSAAGSLFRLTSPIRLDSIAASTQVNHTTNHNINDSAVVLGSESKSFEAVRMGASSLAGMTLRCAGLVKASAVNSETSAVRLTVGDLQGQVVSTTNDPTKIISESRSSTIISMGTRSSLVASAITGLSPPAGASSLLSTVSYAAFVISVASRSNYLVTSVLTSASSLVSVLQRGVSRIDSSAINMVASNSNDTGSPSEGSTAPQASRTNFFFPSVFDVTLTSIADSVRTLSTMRVSTGNAMSALNHLWGHVVSLSTSPTSSNINDTGRVPQATTSPQSRISRVAGWLTSAFSTIQGSLARTNSAVTFALAPANRTVEPTSEQRWVEIDADQRFVEIGVEMRIIEEDPEEGAMPPAFPQKTPADVLDYTFKCRRFIRASPGDYVISSVFTVSDTALSVSTSSFDTEDATVWLEGGVAGETYTVTCTIVTHQGRTAARSATIEVVAVV